MRALAAALLVAGLPATGAANPGPVYLSGYLENDTAWRFRTPRQVQKSQTILELGIEAEVSNSLRVVGLGRLIYDPRRLLVGSDPDQQPIDRWQVAGTLSTEAELRELYVDWKTRVGGARFDVRIGKQQIVWGQAFGLRILDVVNAQDLREFILDDFVDSRIPTFGVRAETFWKGWAFEAFALPDFEPDLLADPSTEFAFDPELTGFLPALAEIPAFPPTLPEPFPFTVILDEDSPQDWRFSNTTWGFRAGSVWKGLDFALYYRDGFDPTIAFTRLIQNEDVTVTVDLGGTPTPITLNVPVNYLRADHFRVRTLGASFSLAPGSFSVWGEGTFTFGRAFVVDDLNDSDGIVRRPDLQYVLGLDWTGLDPLYVGLQWIQRVIMNYRSSIEADHSSEFVSLLLRRPFHRDTIVPQFFGIVGFDEGDTMLRPSIQWKATDRLSITVGADIFTGARDGIFGQFANERECLVVPEVAPIPQAGGCYIEVRPGRTSRAFLRIRYAFDVAE